MDHIDLFNQKPRRQPIYRSRRWKPKVQESPDPYNLPKIETPEDAANYWRQHIATASHYNPDVECLAVILLNAKLRAKKHHIVSIGLLNETVAHPREIFFAAVANSAHALICLHNHPSGEPEPSEADRRMTRTLVAAGEILHIAVQDHVIIGHKRHFSFRECGLI